MAEVLTLSFSDRAPGWADSEKVRLLGNLSGFQSETVESAGPYFNGLLARKAISIDLTKDLTVRSILEEEDTCVADPLPEFRHEDPPEILETDPEAEIQDHYKILGLENYRWRATEKDIRLAYRRKMLKYHPDKSNSPNRFYMCIQRAFTELTNPSTKMYWDSIDPNIDESIPDPNDSGEFYSTYGPVFERESRFSLDPNIPGLGSPDDPPEKVRKFYEAWMSLNSWRTFINPSGAKEVSKCESRSERRYTERMVNDAKSAELKRAYHARLSKLVHQALRHDPRMKRSPSRSRSNKAKDNAIQLEEEQRLARIKKEQEEKISLQQKMQQERRNNKEKEKSLKKIIRRQYREQAAIGADNEADPGAPISPEDLERMISSVDGIEGLAAIVEKLNEAKKDGRHAFFNAISEELKRVTG